MDSPHKTLEAVKAIKDLAKIKRNSCQDRHYNGSEFLHRIVQQLEDIQWEVEESMPEWEKIMQAQ